MTKTLGSLISSSDSLKRKSSPSGATILGVLIYTLGGDKLRIRDSGYQLTSESYKALSYKGFIGKTMKKENDFLMMNNIKRDLGYTGIGDRPSKRKTFFTITLPKSVEDIQNKTFNEIDLEGQGVKIVIQSNIIDIYTRHEILLGLILSGHTEILIEAKKLLDQLYKIGEIQNELEYPNAPKKIFTTKMELPRKILEQFSYNTRPKVGEHMMIVTDKSTHEEHLSQPLQTNNNHFKIAVTFLIGYNDIFNVTNSNKKFYFRKTITKTKI